MVTVLVAHTYELEEADVAVAEILEQLNLDSSLRKNAVGIIACHGDFNESGAVKLLCEKLPFDVVGTTSLASSTGPETAIDILTISVLTSDEVSFSTAFAPGLDAQPHAPLAAAYAEASRCSTEQPALILAYGTPMTSVGTEALISIVDSLSGGVPIFGTLACDHIGLSDSYVIHDGAFHRNAMTLVLLHGPIHPSFHFVSISGKNIQKQRGTITSSSGNILHTINDLPAIDYLESIGINKGQFHVVGSVPFMLDYGDGTTPVGRGYYQILEDGSIACGGEMPVNATVSLATLDYADVMRSASGLIETVFASGAPRGLLLHSCLTRSLVLGPDPLAEAEQIFKAVGGRATYQLSYSGGEICPVRREDGGVTNRFHNFTFIACAL